MSGEARWPPEALRAGGGVGIEVGTAGDVWQSHIHIYKDACRLAQAKGLARLIYHEPALEVRFMRRAADSTRILTIRRCSTAAKHLSRGRSPQKDPQPAAAPGHSSTDQLRT
jgi:hypothetical protein